MKRGSGSTAVYPGQSGALSSKENQAGAADLPKAAPEAASDEDWRPRAPYLCLMRTGEASGQELALGVVFGQLQRLAVGDRSLLRAAQPMQQVRLDRR